MKRLAGWADAHYLELAPHNVGGPVATAANVQFAAATPNVRVVEHFNDFADPWVMTLVDEAPTVSPDDGCFGVSERPGLGVRLDRDVCAEHPATGGRIQLFVARLGEAGRGRRRARLTGAGAGRGRWPASERDPGPRPATPRPPIRPAR